MEKKYSPLKQTEPIIFNEGAFQKPKKVLKEPIHSTKRPIISKLTSGLLTTYKKCNPKFEYSSSLNPRRVLTKPSEPVSNDQFDNANSDYILYVNDTIGTVHKHQYQILDLLGQGTFGQVVKGLHLDSGEHVAIKIVKNKPAYFNQGLVEINILEMLNHQIDLDNQHHFVRLLDYFVFRKHLCLVFELLSLNLYELIKQNQFKGLSMTLIRVFLLQILDALGHMSRAKIIHCDLKPENILLENLTSPAIKIIDFGSACFENSTVYTYIQSRFYRSPEVLIGMPYDSAIDMWSLGCIAAELFLGLPLFPGTSEYNQLWRIIDMLGPIADSLIEHSSKANKFYARQSNGKFTLKSEEQFAKENGIIIQPSKKYFKYRTLPEIIENYVFKENISPEELRKEKENRRAFVDLLNGMLTLDPKQRWTPEQAQMHPFITGEPFTGHFKPPPVQRVQTAPRVIPWGIQHPNQATRPPLAMSFPEIPIGMESYASPHDYFIAQNMQNMQNMQMPPQIPMDHVGMGSPRGRGSYMGSPRHHQYPPPSLQHQAYMNSFYNNNNEHYYNNNNNNNEKHYPRRQRSYSEMGTKQRFTSRNNSNENNGSAPDKRSPRWPQDQKNSERKRARSFGGKNNKSSNEQTSDNKPRRKTSPVYNLGSIPDTDRGLSDRDSHGSNSPVDSPPVEPEHELLFEMEPANQPMYPPQQTEMFNSFANMQIGPHNQMWPPNYPPYPMGNYQNNISDARENEMFTNVYYTSIPPNNRNDRRQPKG